MTRRARQLLLAFVAALFALTLGLFLLNPHLARDPEPPEDVTAMAAWLDRHPADWLTASALADTALDSNVPRRFELWRAAHALARRLAPRRPNADAAFVRGGLFHWYELGEADRKAVLAAAAPLLRDPKLFYSLHRPLWELTRDFAFLRRNAPDSVNALDALRDITVAYGLFAEYRDTRAALLRKRLETFERGRGTMSLADLLRLVPERLDTEHEPLVRRALEELDRRSFQPSELTGAIEPIIDYAIRHDLPGLDGLATLVHAPQTLPGPARARLAIALRRPDDATRIELAEAVPSAPEWVPYHRERALFEARNGNADAAAAQLRRAASAGPDPRVTETSAQVAAILGDQPAAARHRRELTALADAPRAWTGLCGRNELCDWARTRVYVTGGAIVLETDVVQSDEMPPYVEIFVDDTRVAEGTIDGRRRFVVPAANGVRRIEVRLVNRTTSGAAQRRVRLS